MATSILQDIMDGGTPYTMSVEQVIGALKGNIDISAIEGFQQIQPPSTAPTAQASGSGPLTGEYQYCVGFATGFWTISNQNQLGQLIIAGTTGGGPASSSITVSASQVALSNIPIGPPGTVARIIYRTKANGSTFYVVAQINDNTSETWTDTIPDTKLGAQMPTTNTTGTKFVGDGTGLTGVVLTAWEGQPYGVASLDGNAHVYSDQLPIATTSSVGAVKASSSVSVGSDGTLSATPASIGAVNKAGDVMSGALTLQYANPALELLDTSSGGGSWRWYGDGSGGLQLQVYNGSTWVTILTVSSNQNVSFAGQVNLQGMDTQSGDVVFGSKNPFILTPNGIAQNKPNRAYGALGQWYSGIGIQTTDNFATDSNAVFGIVSNDVQEIFQVFNDGHVEIPQNGVTAKIKIAGESWHNVSTFSNGWSNYGNGWAPARYYKDACGIVHLSGMMNVGTLGAAAFTLPAGYRPAYNLSFLTVGSAAPARIDIYPNGQVVPQSYSAYSDDFYSLEGIQFLAEQ